MGPVHTLGRRRWMGFAAKGLPAALLGLSLAGFAGSMGGCTSPTLPLPPPAIPTITASPTAGMVHLTSKNGVEGNAIIVVYNRNPEVPLDRRVGGAQANAEGSWSCDVFASSGDALDITQEVADTRSAPITVKVP